MKGGRAKSGGLARRVKAFARLLRSKMVREKMSPDRIAAGWAIGMFAGCSIPFGFQLVFSIPAAVLTKTSKIGATVATFVTNPVTIFFIYPAQTVVAYKALFGGEAVLPSEWTWEAVKALGWKTVAAFFAGGFAIALVLSPLTFFLVRRTVVLHRSLAGKRLAAKAAGEARR